MVKNVLKGLSLFLAALLLQRVAFAAEVVELPQEELATESVYPVFDKPVSVKNRNVILTNKWEVGAYYGNALTEPIFNVSKFGLSGYFHTSEEHTFGLLFEKNSSGLSKYGDQLKNVTDSSGSVIHYDFTRAPSPTQTMMFDYNFNAYYGKMSLSKSIVFNLTTFGSAAAGMVSYTNKSYPGIALGLGQKYYLSRQFSLRVDLRMFMNNAPVPFYKSDGTHGMKPTEAAPPAGNFSERLTYTTNLDIGVNYLF